jgi:hypothetical protein
MSCRVTERGGGNCTRIPLEEHLIRCGHVEILEMARAVRLQRIDALIRAVLPAAPRLTPPDSREPRGTAPPEVARA